MKKILLVLMGTIIMINFSVLPLNASDSDGQEYDQEDVGEEAGESGYEDTGEEAGEYDQEDVGEEAEGADREDMEEEADESDLDEKSGQRSY